MPLCYFHNNDLDIRLGGAHRLKSSKWIKETSSHGKVDRGELFVAAISCRACRSFNENCGYIFWDKKEVDEYLSMKKEGLRQENQAKKRRIEKEMNEPVLEAIERHLKSHDWWHEFSDDSRVWKKGREHWEYICTLFERARRENKTGESAALFKKFAHERFKCPS